MKSALFARPNLKVLIAAAAVIVAVEHFVGVDDSAESSLQLEATLAASPLADDQLHQLIEQTLEHPSSENYMLVSDCLRKRGDIRGAMSYLRKAGMAAQHED